jgi:hypothetical protein
MEQLANQVAQKHGAGQAKPVGKPVAQALPGLNKGGRRPVAVEASEYLSKNGLVAVPANQVGGAVEPQAVPQYVVSPEFVKKCSETLLKGIESWRQRMVYVKAVTISKDKELSKQLADESGASPGTIEVMGTALAELSQKYQLLASWTPEAILCVAAATWVTKEVTLQKKLNELEAMVMEARKKVPQAQTMHESTVAELIKK